MSPRTSTRWRTTPSIHGDLPLTLPLTLTRILTLTLLLLLTLTPTLTRYAGTFFAEVAGIDKGKKGDEEAGPTTTAAFQPGATKPAAAAAGEVASA